MKNSFLILCSALILSACTAKQNQSQNQSESAQADSKSIVVYYSQYGATKQVAEYFAKAANANIDSVVAENPYSGDFNATIARCQEEMQKGILPAVKSSRNVADFDTIYVGYPVWFGVPAPPMTAWLKSVDLSGKVIIPFCTFGSGGNTSIETVRQSVGDATILDYYGVRNARVAKAPAEIENFLISLGVKKGEVAPVAEMSAQEDLTDATRAIFQAACGSYQMPLGEPISVATNGTDYVFTVKNPNAASADEVSIILVSAPEGETPEFTEVIR